MTSLRLNVDSEPTSHTYTHSLTHPPVHCSHPPTHLMLLPERRPAAGWACPRPLPRTLRGLSSWPSYPYHCGGDPCPQACTRFTDLSTQRSVMRMHGRVHMIIRGRRCLHAYVQVGMGVCMHAYMQVGMAVCICVGVFMHACMVCACMHMCSISACMRMCRWACMHAYV